MNRVMRDMNRRTKKEKLLSPEEIEKEKVRIQKMKQTRSDNANAMEGTHDGRPGVFPESWDDDPLLLSLWLSHPERRMEAIIPGEWISQPDEILRSRLDLLRKKVGVRRLGG